MKVAISSRFLPHYRIAFFEQLQRALGLGAGELRVFFNFSLGDLARCPSWATRVPAVRKDVRIGELEEHAVFGPGLFRELVRYAPDVLVLEDLGGLPNSLIGAMYARLWHRPYLIWGLGKVPQKRASPLRSLLRPFIQLFYGNAAGFICYSRYAAEVYSTYHKPTYVAPNSFLPAPSDEATVRIENALARRYSASPFRVVSIGTVKTQKRYDVLLDAISKMPPNVHLDLIGDGPELGALKHLAERLSIADRVVFHGSLYDSAAKAALLDREHIGVIPGRGGLAIQEMMAYGIPVVCGVADGTENDLIRTGQNGYLLNGLPESDAICSALEQFFSRDADQRTAMAREALSTVVHESNISVMLEGFIRGLREAVRT